MRTVSRRKKYPAKASMILEMIYKKNRKSLKDLKVKTEKQKVDMSGVSDDTEDIRNSLAEVEKRLKSSQAMASETKNKASRLVEAFKIMKNVEEAARVHDEVMSSN